MDAATLHGEAFELRERLSIAYREARRAGDTDRMVRVWRVFKKARTRMNRRDAAWQAEKLAAWKGA